MDTNNVNGLNFRSSAKTAEITSNRSFENQSLIMNFLTRSLDHLKKIKVYIIYLSYIYIGRGLFRRLCDLFPLSAVNAVLFVDQPKTKNSIPNVSYCGSARLGAAWGGKVNPNTQPRK